MATGLLGVVLAGCSTSARPEPTATATATARTHAAAPQPFNVGTGVAGAPDQHDPTFLRDQENLYDPSQFGNPMYYQAGYHWKIDPSIGPHSVVRADVVRDSASGDWAVTLNFTAAAAQRLSAITTAAFDAGQGSPLNRIAFFVGNRVVSAPNVQAPSSSSSEITGNFTEQSALDLAQAISAAASS